MEGENTNPQNNQPRRMSRRDVLKGLATLPVAGAFLYSFGMQRRQDKKMNDDLRSTVDVSREAPVFAEYKPGNRVIRIGIIGYGGRGEHLVRSIGYAHPEVIDEWEKAARENPKDKRLEDFRKQDNLNVVVTAVCDVYQVRADRAVLASANEKRLGSEGEFGTRAKLYKDYRDLLASNDVDAVIIATPDHWHAQMIIDAAKAGKHVYVEKAMTRTVEETFAAYDAVKASGIVFQLGHQARQTESYIKAREAIEKGVLGKISLVEVTTNRNSPNGAWVYDIDEGAGEQNIDWERFLGNAPKIPFSAERFFRWRCWWDYGTGLGGDLLTHEYDGINQIMGLGIPYSAVATGGVYFYKNRPEFGREPREVPDVFQAAFEYPDRDLTLLYSATLSSQKNRGKVIMGHDAWMELGESLFVYADPESTKYKPSIDDGTINLEQPIYSYMPGQKNVDAVTTATERYFAGRGLLYTYRNGKRIDTSHLHLREWIEAIRTDGKTSCDIEQGFQEAITAHMATISYREQVKVFWDPDKREVIRGPRVQGSEPSSVIS